MAQSFGHACICFALPDLEGDAKRWNLQGPDAAVGPLHAIGAGIGRLLIDDRRSRILNFRSGHIGAVPGSNTVAGSARHRIDALLQPGQQGFFREARLGGAETTVLQFRYLVVHHIGSAVIIPGTVDILIGGGTVIIR